MVDTKEFEGVLRRVRDGDEEALEVILAAHYNTLREMAGRELDRFWRDKPWSRTEIVNGLFVKIVRQKGQHDWKDKKHFLCSMRLRIRNFLRDRHRTSKVMATLGDEQLDRPPEPENHQVMALRSAMNDLRDRDERGARALDLKYNHGYRDREAAELMGMSLRNYQRCVAEAKSWLRRII